MPQVKNNKADRLAEIRAKLEAMERSVWGLSTDLRNLAMELRTYLYPAEKRRMEQIDKDIPF